ncbi:MAG TPA: ABC transporter permease [Acidimicrobiia bacterium]|nr:ABC transporter permease [Acidimicrobiia bacterium]
MAEAVSEGPVLALSGSDRFRLGHGWKVVARKEFGDHVLSARFYVLILILGVAAAGAVFAASGGIRSVAPDAVGVPAIFLKLFTVTTEPVPFPLVVFIGFLGPLLGIMFGFDSISGERSQGTLPRLLAQPIHRDEVILGKFVGGLAVVGLMLTALTVFVAGIGIFRLGLFPTGSEVGRLFVWLTVAIIYVGFWQALATLASVMVPRAATSALVAVGIWLVLALFGPFIFRAAGNLVASGDDPNAALRAEVALSRVSPLTLFSETSTVLLDPAERTVGLITLEQVNRALVSNLTLSQSLMVVWPQIVGLIALTSALFAAAYVNFMRQEVRA